MGDFARICAKSGKYFDLDPNNGLSTNFVNDADHNQPKINVNGLP